jgi:transcriptional regulator with XRE-family HTH domain
MNIGEKLKLRRKKVGYTQERVAEMMNITRQTLSNWEIGKNYPDIDCILLASIDDQQFNAKTVFEAHLLSFNSWINSKCTSIICNLSQSFLLYNLVQIHCNT